MTHVDSLNNQDWLPGTAGISLATQAQGAASMFVMLVPTSAGYVQSGPGSFMRISGTQGRLVPASSKQALVEINADAKPPAEATLFLLEFDKQGARLNSKSEKTAQWATYGGKPISATFSIHPKAAKYMVALRIRNYEGELSINSSKVSFSGRK